MFLDLRQSYEKPALAQAFNLWVDIHAPIGMVFRFLTEEAGLNRWWTNHCTSEPRPGGRLYCAWESDHELTGEAFFRQFEPPNRLVVEWTHNNGQPINCDGTDPRGMRWPALTIYNLALIHGQITRLHLHDLGIHHGVEYASIREATGVGWVKTMEQLKKVAEQEHRQKMLARQKRRLLAHKQQEAKAKEQIGKKP